MDLPTSIKQQFMVEFMSECDESSVSSLSDISSTTSKRSKANEPRHHRNLCLLCCRSTLPTLSPSKEYSILNNVQKSDAIDTDNAVRNALLSTATATTTTILPSTNITTTPQRRKNGRANLYNNTEITFNSPDSLLHEDNANEKIANSILLHVQRMANPVWSKQSRMALFKLKQAHQHVFQDICVYSEVCKALGRNTYRLNARRFLQELFLDLDYQIFYSEALEIIKTKESDLSACDITMDIESTNEFAFATSSPIVDRSRPSSLALKNVSTIANTMNTITTPTTPTTPTSSSVSSSSATASVTVPYSIKTHLLKSPPLASVYETSRENLSESFGNGSKIMNSTTIVNNKLLSNELSFDQPDSVISSASTPKTTTTITTVEINQYSIPNDYRTCTLINSNNNKNNNNSINNMNEQRRTYSRPRFNTLELDLSCTKNKFPITDRRKNYDSVTSIISNSALYSQRITKSLSASITTPTNALFCEKRLNSSKSEAILSNHVTMSTANCEQGTFQK